MLSDLRTFLTRKLAVPSLGSTRSSAWICAAVTGTPLTWRTAVVYLAAMDRTTLTGASLEWSTARMDEVS